MEGQGMFFTHATGRCEICIMIHTLWPFLSVS